MSDVNARCLRREEPELKLCIDCKHSRCPFGSWECHHPKSDGWVISPVDGKLVHNKDARWPSYCDSARIAGPCGKEGKRFEEREAQIPEKFSIIRWFFTRRLTGSGRP